MSEYTESDLDITGDTYDIPPHNWRNCSCWYGGAMVRPLTNDALNYCCANGTYFETPNAYFVEGWEDGDCQDCQVLGTGTAPQLGDRCQHQLTEIWEEMFEKAEEPAAPFKPLETFNESVERAAVFTIVTPETLAAVEKHVRRAECLHDWHEDKPYTGPGSVRIIIANEWDELEYEFMVEDDQIRCNKEHLQRIHDEAMDLLVTAIRCAQKAQNDLDRLKGAK